MLELESENLWNQLEKLSQNSKNKSAAVAYITKDEYICFKEGDILIVDASISAIEQGKTCAKVLSRAFHQGAELYSNESLHAKTIVFDSKVYIGSANISSRSRKSLIELGLITDDIQTLEQALKFIESLKHKSTLLTKEAIDDLLAINVKEKYEDSSKKPTILIDRNSIIWGAGVYSNAEYDCDIDEVEQTVELLQANTSENLIDYFFLKEGYYKTLYKKADVGDKVVIFWRPTSSHDITKVYLSIIRKIEIKKNNLGEERKIFYYSKLRDPISKDEFDAHIGSDHKLATTKWVGRELRKDESKCINQIWK
jgi:hypothetical protein